MSSREVEGKTEKRNLTQPLTPLNKTNSFNNKPCKIESKLSSVS